MVASLRKKTKAELEARTAATVFSDTGMTDAINRPYSRAWNCEM